MTIGADVQEGRCEVGAALRHKDDPMRCVVFKLALYYRYRFVVLGLFDIMWFVPKVSQP